MRLKRRVDTSEFGRTAIGSGPMHTIELTNDELRLLHAALHSYLDDFGHEEADLLRQIKQLLAKLPATSQ
jgi:hypothetical protein